MRLTGGFEHYRLLSAIDTKIRQKSFSAVSTVYMRIATLLIALAASACSAPKTAPVSRLDLPLEQRLDAPQRIASVPLRLTDFVSFIATSFKVPLLVETPGAVAPRSAMGTANSIVGGS